MDYVQRLLQAIDLGVEEWNREVPTGLFFSQRPLGIVHCNSNADAAIAERAMEHLLRDIDVPAVLALTDVDFEAVESLALKADVTSVCIDCYAPAKLPPQLEGGLVWRMLPGLEQQAELAAWRVNDLERRIRTNRGSNAATSIRVAVWSDADDAFMSFGAKLRELLRFNGDQDVDQNGANYLELHNVDPRYQSQDQLEYVGRIVDFAPDILVVAINEDFTAYYLRMVEAEWPSSRPRPHYVATLVNQELNALAPIIADDDDLRLRLSGTGLLLEGEVSKNLAGFRARYEDRYGVHPGRTQAGYDAWYATVLAIYSADAEGRLDGSNIAAHFSRLTTGAITDVDPRALASARVYLSAQQGIDLVGTSSQLNWDPITRRVTADGALWCLSRDANGILQIDDDAGPRWTSAGVTGSFDCP